MCVPVHLLYIKFTKHKITHKNYVVKSFYTAYKIVWKGMKIIINVLHIILTSQTLHLFSHILWQMEKWLPLLCTQHSRGTPQGDLPLITASRWKRGGDKTSVKYRRYSNSKILFIKYFLE